MAFRLRWPTQYPTIIQPFGVNRTGVPNFYTQFGLPAHEGLDFVAPTGSEIYACADGEISEISRDGRRAGKPHAYGIQVRITHKTDEGEYETIYGHLLRPLESLQVGQRVVAGQLIGLADNTGNSRGDHLHLTLKKKGATKRGETSFVLANGTRVTYPLDILDPTPFLEPFSGEVPKPKPVDNLKFLADVTIPDDSVVPAGAPIIKTWQIRNSGTSDWTDKYTLEFSSNTPLSSVRSVALPAICAGEEVAVSVELTAPLTPGRYRTTYRAKDANGKAFGTPLFMIIRVVKA
jgi:murein DD-endopeptidase MepM/ murein hydrolase activator NlpD